MENEKKNLDQEISKEKAERGIDKLEYIYQQLQEPENTDEEGAGACISRVPAPSFSGQCILSVFSIGSMSFVEFPGCDSCQ